MKKRVSYKKFEIEKNAKNKAYYFILLRGLMNDFSRFCKNYNSDNPHRDCIQFLLERKGFVDCELLNTK